MGYREPRPSVFNVNANGEWPINVRQVTNEDTLGLARRSGSDLRGFRLPHRRWLQKITSRQRTIISWAASTQANPLPYIVPSKTPSYQKNNTPPPTPPGGIVSAFPQPRLSCRINNIQKTSSLHARKRPFFGQNRSKFEEISRRSSSRSLEIGRTGKRPAEFRAVSRSHRQRYHGKLETRWRDYPIRGSLSRSETGTNEGSFN